MRATRENHYRRESETPEVASWWQRARRRNDALGSFQCDDTAPPGGSVSPTTASNSTSDGEAHSTTAPRTRQSGMGTLPSWPVGTRSSTSTSLVNKLPPELLINVLQHLPSNHDLLSAMLVSKTWCLAAFPLIWQRPPLHSITQFAKFVRTLNDPDALLPYATTVRRLVCSGFARDMTDELFRKVSCCHNLERLFIPGADLSSAALATVFQHLPDLISVDLGGIDGVNDIVAQRIATVCTQVQGLNLTRCKRVGDEGIIAIANNLKMLRRMKLHGCHRLTDRSIIALVRSCPLLSELDVMAIPQLSDDTTIAVFLNAAHLRDFKMKEAKDHEKLDQAAIPNLWELSRMEEAHLFDVLGTYPWYLTGSSAPKAQAITQQSSRPPNVTATLLRPLRLTLDALRVVDFTSCSGLGDISVDNLVCNAPQLRSLTLTKCDNLTDASLDSIARLGKYIHYLHLGHVNQITDAGILQLSRNCTRLRYIDVANCSQLSDLSVVALATNLPKLRRIGLVKVNNVTDDGIMPLADRFLTLERIHLSWCDKISVRAVAYLLNRLPLLTHLSLSGIPAFKTAELQRFCRAPPEGLNDGQRGSFCVYSGPGVAALRNHLNAQVSQELSDASSGRQSSTSSTSSVTVPGPPIRGTVWNGNFERSATSAIQFNHHHAHEDGFTGAPQHDPPTAHESNPIKVPDHSEMTPLPRTRRESPAFDDEIRQAMSALQVASVASGSGSGAPGRFREAIPFPELPRPVYQIDDSSMAPLLSTPAAARIFKTSNTRPDPQLEPSDASATHSISASSAPTRYPNASPPCTTPETLETSVYTVSPADTPQSRQSRSSPTQTESERDRGLL